jgi:hypothetical protein
MTERGIMHLAIGYSDELEQTQFGSTWRIQLKWWGRLFACGVLSCSSVVISSEKSDINIRGVRWCLDSLAKGLKPVTGKTSNGKHSEVENKRPTRCVCDRLNQPER